MVDTTAQVKEQGQQVEREVAQKYQALQRETQALVQRLHEIQDEQKENE